MVETPAEVREAIDRISTGALLRTRSGIASLTILALGFLIPVLVLLPVRASRNDRSLESEKPGEVLVDAVTNGSFGGALNAIPFALCAAAAFWQLRPSHRSTRDSLPGMGGLLLGGVALFSSSIYYHAELWNTWYDHPESSTVSVGYVIAPFFGGVFLMAGYSAGWLGGWVARFALRCLGRSESED